MTRYLPELSRGWAPMTVATLVWCVLDWAFDWPGEPAYAATFLFVFALGAAHGYRRAKETP